MATTYLSIDPGGKRTGLAVGDDGSGIVSPVDVIEAPNPELRLRLLIQAVEEQRPDALVLGYPLNMDGSEGPGAEASRKLADQLHEATGLEVLLVDERLTSFEADEQMAGHGLTRKRKKNMRDALAAANILRGYFAQQAAEAATQTPTQAPTEGAPPSDDSDEPRP